MCSGRLRNTECGGTWLSISEPSPTTSLNHKAEHSTVRLRSSYRVADVEVFDAKPETLQNDLDRAFDKKPA